ncbi:hypothetical protein HWV62_44502 [Athelia sp. TMB]|nr:hypothetical protein HWV62_44502 [Athelia sp. TMB]
MKLRLSALPTSQVRHCQAHKVPSPVPPEVATLLSSFAANTPAPISLAQLLSFGRPLTPASVLDSVRYALREIPRRLATRVRHLEALPFIVGTNPYVAGVLATYRESFMYLARYPPVHTLEENDAFARELEGIVRRHANDIPTMAKGFQECARYMSPAQISAFLDGAIRNRISVRLIAEQHIALSRALGETGAERASADPTGVVDMACAPAQMVRHCGAFVRDLCDATLGASPALIIDGHADAVFPYVPVHLEYILTELLKNAFRATVEHHHKTLASPSLPSPSSYSEVPPVRVTISPPPASAPPGAKFLALRIRDQGGGVVPANMARIFSYAFTTAAATSPDDDGGGGPYAAQHVGGAAAVGSMGGGAGAGNVFGEMAAKGLQAGMGTIAGLGYGLPMSRLYARYFGGSLELLSLDGWGTDVYVKLRCLDEAGDAEI